MTPRAAVLNLSALLSDEETESIALVAERWFSDLVCPAWGVEVPVIEFSSSKTLPTSGDFLAFVDEDPNGVEGALGYHYESDSGQCAMLILAPVIIDQPGGFVHRGPVSCSAVGLHELGEWRLDRETNLWRLAPDGYEYPQEICDGVQGNVFDMQGRDGPVSVPDFLHPAWFDGTPALGARFSQLGTLSAPFAVDVNGYTERRPMGGGETEVWGTRFAWKTQAVLRPRSARRRAIEKRV